MRNALWKNIDEMDDLRAKGMYYEAIERNDDPDKVLKYFEELGRDNARTPMQWNDNANAGFTEGTPWMKVNENYPAINVAEQEQNPSSILSFYKKVTRLRRDPKYRETFAEGSFSPLYENIPALIAYTRKRDVQTITVIVNFKNECQAIPSVNGKCILNNNDSLLTKENRLLLQPYQAIVFAD